MCELKTLVYCDLEATGLKNSGRPRITEVSLVAVNTASILDLNAMLLSRLQKSKIKVESKSKAGGGVFVATLVVAANAFGIRTWPYRSHDAECNAYP